MMFALGFLFGGVLCVLGMAFWAFKYFAEDR